MGCMSEPLRKVIRRIRPATVNWNNGVPMPNRPFNPYQALQLTRPSLRSGPPAERQTLDRRRGDHGFRPN